MKSQAGVNSSEKILVTATRMAQAHGYGGLNIRNLAEEVGIKAASLYHHFPGKAELAAAVARRYREDAAVTLDTLWSEAKDPLERLRRYPAETFRKSLENGNRMCLASFMTAEYDDLPDIVKKEAQAFADVNIEWLRKALLDADLVGPGEAKRQARAIFAAVAGAQLVARSFGPAIVRRVDRWLPCVRAFAEVSVGSRLPLAGSSRSGALAMVVAQGFGVPGAFVAVALAALMSLGVA